MNHPLDRFGRLALLLGLVLIGVGPAAFAQQIRFLSAVEQPDRTTVWGDFDHRRVSADVELAHGDREPLHPRDGAIQNVNGAFLVAFRQPTDAVQPETSPPLPDPQQPETSPPLPDPRQPETRSQQSTQGTSAGDDFNFSIAPPPRAAAAQSGSPAASGATGEQAVALGQPDLGGLLAQSNSVNSVEVQRRSPVALDPNIRGYKQGQIYTQSDGAYWFAARQDLDTQLSKIDPAMIQDVVVIPGPYGVKYGPGFAFIDIVTTPTPRNECGFESDFRTILNWRGNGDQVFARQTVEGGDRNWGYRVSYGHRTGVDYEAGDGTRIPSGFQVRDLWGEVGYSLGPSTRVEFQYLRVDQTDTEYAGQFFDIDYLVTDGFNLRYIDDADNGIWSGTTVTGWYNRTRFAGSTDQKEDSFAVLNRAERAVDDFVFFDAGMMPQPFPQIDTVIRGLTDGDIVSTGARGALRFGDRDCAHLELGADFRYLEQQINESFTFSNVPLNTMLPVVNTNMPRAWMTDPGVYAEMKMPMTSYWKSTVGARADWIHTDALESEVRADTSLNGGNTLLSQDDTLYALFLSNEFMINQNWTVRAGVGYAQRPPTLIERYSDALFLGIIQSGFTRVIGDPTLDPERNTQVDLGLQADYDNLRARGTVFHSWVNDYITVSDDQVRLPTNFTDARLLRFRNTDQATLAGFELAGEYDLSRVFTPFATMRYVEGRDQEINVPLPSIAPLEATVGGRLHDPCGGRTWSIEMACRMVDNQDRLGAVLLQGQPQALEEETPGFSVWHLRGYYNVTRDFHLVGGVDNLFDHVYQQHLDLRFRDAASPFPSPTRVLAPGVTPYAGIDWRF